jgi:hypothetical protein
MHTKNRQLLCNTTQDCQDIIQDCINPNPEDTPLLSESGFPEKERNFKKVVNNENTEGNVHAKFNKNCYTGTGKQLKM